MAIMGLVKEVQGSLEGSLVIIATMAKHWVDKGSLGPERSREVRRGPERFRKTQISSDRPREAHVDPDSKSRSFSLVWE